MDEFSLIRTYFAPLSQGFSGSLNLTDDAALISILPGDELAITKDAISEGVHFLGQEEPALVAKKLLRINLSDLAAMGATPLAYFLAIMLPGLPTEAWVKSFCEGLHDDQEQFGIHLAGGDTISTHGPVSFSVTAIGTVPQGKSLRRSGAKPGDIIYVSGTLGDSALGLGLLQKTISSNVSAQAYEWLTGRYFLPEPRVALGKSLISVAHSAIDISDGLWQDLGHICEASGVGACVDRALLPLSDAASGLITADETLWKHVTSGGDDYELLFTAPPGSNTNLHKISAAIGIRVTAIGEITSTKDRLLLDEHGKILSVPRQGFDHFL